MNFNDSNMIVILTVLFVVIGVSTSVIYYFARYFFRTGKEDKEVLTKKPLEYGLSEHGQKADVQTTEPVAAPQKTVGDALKVTRETFWGRLAKLTGGDITPQIRDEIEEILLTSDLGPRTADVLFQTIDESLSRSDKKSVDEVKDALRKEMESILKEGQEKRSGDLFAHWSSHPKKPLVWMMVGVNGAGKTTTIGKLAAMAKEKGLSVMVAAGDTFRAAADSQLKVWAERTGARIFSPETTKDPAAVAHMALEQALRDGTDLVLVDTAGRLHTQENLMEELRKIKRVMAKVVPDSPHEVLLTVDANSGQNALQQAKQFHAALELTGVVISKLDGTAKGGVLVGIAHELKLPICYIGIGERVEDLKAFDPREFVESIL